MNIYELQKRHEALAKRKAILENQREVLVALDLASAQLWPDEDYVAKCRDLQRAVAREVVRTCWQIWDISAPTHPQEQGVAAEPDKENPDDPPF